MKLKKDQVLYDPINDALALVEEGNSFCLWPYWLLQQKKKDMLASECILEVDIISRYFYIGDL